MMRVVLLVALALTASACSGPVSSASNVVVPSALRRDIGAYAAASCFSALPDPFLKTQGDRWAGAVIQRGHGPIEAWSALADAVVAELQRSGVAQGQGDGPAAPTNAMPVMTCGEIVDTPAVRMAMAKAGRTLRSSYPVQR